MINGSIRPAYVAEHGLVVDMSARFWELTWYEEPFDPWHVRKMVELAAANDLLLVLERAGGVHGFVAAIAQPLLGNGSCLQVTELGYWVDPEHRGHGLGLLKGLERAALMVGAKYLNMIAMESSHPDIAEAIYRRRGYVKIESTWCKRLKGGSAWPSQPQS